MAQNFASRRLADSFSLTVFLVLICFTSSRLYVPGDFGCPGGGTPVLVGLHAVRVDDGRVSREPGYAEGMARNSENKRKKCNLPVQQGDRLPRVILFFSIRHSVRTVKSVYGGQGKAERYISPWRMQLSRTSAIRFIPMYRHGQG